MFRKIGKKDLFFILFLAFFALYLISFLFSNSYTDIFNENLLKKVGSATASSSPVVAEFKVTHRGTPKSVKAIYMTSWVAGSPTLRNKLVKMIDDTEINSVVIDIKDYTGRISFNVDDKDLKKFGSEEDRIPDVKKFIGTLHEKGVYVIGRISVFQDAYMVKKNPQWAVYNKSGNSVWKDRKGISWIDAGAKPYWDYIVSIAKESYAFGFDELNFDYIRFPSDGNMNDISYKWSLDRKKSDVLNSFFAYLDKQLDSINAPISADLFGMTTTNKDDLGIGQVLENAMNHFDYVAPMVYPSHYPAGFNGWKNPNALPYDVIKYSMSRAVERKGIASTSKASLRPWLQDFSLDGVVYDSQKVRDQIRATYDVGLDSWMLWSASNRYTESALLKATSTKLAL